MFLFDLIKTSPYRILFYILIPYFIFLILIQLRSNSTETFVSSTSAKSRVPPSSPISNASTKIPISIKDNPRAQNIKRDLEEQKQIKKHLKDLDEARQKDFVQEYDNSTKTELEVEKLYKEINSLKKQLKDCSNKKVKKEKSEEESILKSTDTDSDSTNSSKEQIKKIVVGCEKDKDCNLFYGDGKNTCKSNNQCRCEVGAGVLCQNGPTHYKDPKDMTKKEKTIFKNMSNYDNFTIQDYKNWLGLYNKDYYLLSDEHLINLRKVMRGEPLALRDIPTGGLRPPLTSQKYFAEMYDKLGELEQIVSPINSSTTGNQVGYNYNEYSDFSPPNAIPMLRVVNGEIERKYRRPSAINKIFPVPLEDAIGPYNPNPSM